MQLNTIFKRKNNIKFPKFNYWMWVKVRLIIPSRRFGGGQRLMVRVPRQTILLQQYWCCWFCRCDLRGFWWCFKGGIAGVPWVVAQNVSLELWLGIGVKHVVFLELWLGIASLELWLGMADEHEEPLSCGSGGPVLPVWVCWLWPVGMGPARLPSSVVGWRVW